MRIKSFILALILGCMSVFATISTARADEAFLTYTPSSGSINFSSSTANGREAKATFKWNIAGCSEFNDSNDTYEQELVFYNYDGKAYATSMRSYRTNLPNHYSDTRFCDSQNEINLAVGTYSANSIIPNKEYYVTYRLGVGNSNRSKYKISVQEGRYYVFQEPETVFAESTAKLIPFKNGFNAPEFRRWNTEIEYNDTIKRADSSGVNRWFSGVISRKEDVDYVRFQLKGRRGVRFISPRGSNIDYDVKIYDKNGNYTGRCLTSTDLEQVKYFNFESGYYYFRIYPYGEGTSSLLPYYLIVT